MRYNVVDTILIVDQSDGRRKETVLVCGCFGVQRSVLSDRWGKLEEVVGVTGLQ